MTEKQALRCVNRIIYKLQDSLPGFTELWEKLEEENEHWGVKDDLAISLKDEYES